jgi:multidrug efflux pump subunit AcrB
VNPTALASYGIGFSQLMQAIASANANQAKGTFDGPQRAYTIDANDQLTSGPRTDRWSSPTRRRARAPVGRRRRR